MQPLVFVDLETTGAVAAKDRIKEIGIILVDTNGAEEWSTLVNPETHISGFIERLTGITNKMVLGAPLCSDVANQVFKMLSGRMLLARNAGFDYAFLKQLFFSRGARFFCSNALHCKAVSSAFSGVRQT